ncbi:Com family DNA-binding transcriptional regulator [Candidatus Vondammii sp. HM_W22]|uniref:Com family DNA-binding transcriptional regulator n=1 Tax=Candidatus Vondammii sp. HM_W22 TaxID=2687299 RepID=UPI001F1453E6|nr:Com family DNA-binding transcriptional regulator [Candidatus Vondammii sp. HM_W22]
MTNIRCGHCNKLLAKGDVKKLQIQCPRCRTLNHIEGQGTPSENAMSVSSKGAIYGVQSQQYQADQD